MTPDLYWIPGPWQGKLAVATRPRGGEWLADELRSWREAGLNGIISLLELDEATQLGLEDEAAVARSLGLEFLSLPIPDRGVPGSGVDILRFLTKVTSALATGRNVAVHCRQGVGRSGMVASAALIASGTSAREATDIVGRARGVLVPETPDQLRWLEHLASERLVSAP
jgi:protein-tyrosine phosphatase